MQLLTIDLPRTPENLKFLIDLKNSINKDYPDSAFLRGEKYICVEVTDEYYQNCCKYVECNCKVNNSWMVLHERRN